MSTGTRNLVGRQRRHRRVRKIVKGTPERPRLVVFRSSKHIYAQLVDDTNDRTLTGVSTLSKEIKEKASSGATIQSAQLVGEAIAETAKARGIEKVVFDRGGYRYHGRVKAVADGARSKGLVL